MVYIQAFVTQVRLTHFSDAFSKMWCDDDMGETGGLNLHALTENDKIIFRENIVKKLLINKE